MSDFPSEYLQRLGLTKPEISIFLTLVKYGGMSLSELSRKSGVERTALYRLVSPLEGKGLINIQVNEKRKIISPVGSVALNRLLVEKQSELNTLKTQESEFIEHLKQMSGTSSDTNIDFYRGVEGIKQAKSNTIANNKHKTIHSLAHRALENITGDLFLSDWHKEFQQIRMSNRIVYSDDFISSLNKFSDSTSKSAPKGLRFHYLNSNIFEITQNLDVYNQTTVYYFWSDLDAYAVEITNPKIAKTNRQLVEILVKQSEKPKTLEQVFGEIKSS